MAYTWQSFVVAFSIFHCGLAARSNTNFDPVRFPGQVHVRELPPSILQQSRPSVGFKPLSSSIQQSNNVYPTTQLTLPSPTRLTPFRVISRRPGKVIIGGPVRPPARIVPPATQFTLPYPQRRIPFRTGKVIVGRPSALPTTSINSNNNNDDSFAQLLPALRIPILDGEIIIGYAERSHNWFD